jgi:hypothetical protein
MPPTGPPSLEVRPVNGRSSFELDEFGSRPGAGKAVAATRQCANDGEALVAVDVAEINHTPTSNDHQAVARALKDSIETLEAVEQPRRSESAASVAFRRS